MLAYLCVLWSLVLALFDKWMLVYDKPRDDTMSLDLEEENIVQVKELTAQVVETGDQNGC